MLSMSPPREVEALYWRCAEWLPNRQVAERMTISVKTVEAHLAHAQVRLGFSSVTAMHRWLFRRWVLAHRP